MLVEAARFPLKTTREAEEEIAKWEETGKIVSDGVARTIASWYQSSGTIGEHFAALASTGQCEYDLLADDVRRTKPHDDEQESELKAFKAWLENKARTR